MESQLDHWPERKQEGIHKAGFHGSEMTLLYRSKRHAIQKLYNNTRTGVYNLMFLTCRSSGACRKGDGVGRVGIIVGMI